MNPCGSGWMWSAMPPACTVATAIYWCSTLLQRIQECDKVRNVFVGERIGRLIRHHAHRAGEALLENCRAVRGRRIVAVDQLRMLRIVQHAFEARAHDLLIERTDSVTRRTFRCEERLTGHSVATRE